MCWLIQSLKKLEKDGATPSLLLKIQSLPCRSEGTRTICLAGSAPGEKLVAIYTCCRYGPDWAQWREISGEFSPEAGNEATLDLGLDANRKITSVTGNSRNDIGSTWMLQAQLSDSTWGPHGDSRVEDGFSERPSPSSAQLVLSHLSGDETEGAWILRFHWRPQ